MTKRNHSIMPRGAVPGLTGAFYAFPESHSYVLDVPKHGRVTEQGKRRRDVTIRLKKVKITLPSVPEKKS